METQENVAQIILAQLGGNKFLAMTGAHSFSSGPDSLSFRIGGNSGRWQAVRITLNGLDLYDVGFFRMRGMEIQKKEIKNVYADQLQQIFTSETGLITSL